MARAWSRPSSWQGPAIRVSGRRFETAISPIRTVLASVIVSSRRPRIACGASECKAARVDPAGGGLFARASGRGGESAKGRTRMLEDIRGKAALVTGASTGIGAAVAVGLAALGAKVAVHYNRSAEAARGGGRGDRRGRGHGGAGPGRPGGGGGRGRGGASGGRGAGRARHPGQQRRGDPAAAAVRRAVARALPGGAGPQRALGDPGVAGGAPAPRPAGRRVDRQHRLDRRQQRRRAGVGALRLCQGLYPQPDPAHGAGPRGAEHPGERGGAGGDRRRRSTRRRRAERMEAMRKAVALGRLGQAEDCVGPIVFFARR